MNGPLCAGITPVKWDCFQGPYGSAPPCVHSKAARWMPSTCLAMPPLWPLPLPLKGETQLDSLSLSPPHNAVNQPFSE